METHARRALTLFPQTSVSYKMVPTPIRELREYRVVDMAMGPTHTAVLVSSGRVFTFGRNMEGQLGTGHVTISSMVTKTEALQGKAMVRTCTETWDVHRHLASCPAPYHYDVKFF